MRLSERSLGPPGCLLGAAAPTEEKTAPRAQLKVLGLLLLVAFLLAACATSRPAPTTGETELVVFAASSLLEPFTSIGRRFAEENPSIKVTFNFGGSQQLRSQLEQGARADVFASASREEMEKAKAAGLIGEPRVFARNRLIVILPKGQPGRVAGLRDLARPGLKLVLANRSVPVGAYTLTSLDKMSADPVFGPAFKARVLANVVSEEDSVKKVVTKVRLGEADGGIVYSSDLTTKVRAETETIDIPGQFNVVAEYPIAPIFDSRHRDEAKAFGDFVLSAAGQSVLVENGFLIEGTAAR